MIAEVDETEKLVVANRFVELTGTGKLSLNMTDWNLKTSPPAPVVMPNPLLQIIKQCLLIIITSQIGLWQIVRCRRRRIIWCRIWIHNAHWAIGTDQVCCLTIIQVDILIQSRLGSRTRLLPSLSGNWHARHCAASQLRLLHWLRLGYCEDGCKFDV